MRNYDTKIKVLKIKKRRGRKSRKRKNISLFFLTFGILNPPEDRGRYLFTSLPSGNYSIKVEAAGFQPFQAQIAIEVNANLTANAKLQIAGAQESVVVSSASPIAAHTADRWIEFRSDTARVMV